MIKMRTTLVVPEDIAAKLRDAAASAVETGAVMLARYVRTLSGSIRLLARELHFVPDAAYVKREPYELVIGSAGYVPALGRAEMTRTVAIWLHTHPGQGASPRASRHDEVVDRELADLFRLRTGSGYYGALILARDNHRLRFTGFLEGEDLTRQPIDRLLTIGARFQLAWNDDDMRPSIEDLYDRNVRAFGGQVQAALGDLTVAVVGCGGTGSAVAEQLVRLGVRHVLLADPDRLSESNVTRVYGSTPDDVGGLKVEILRAHLGNIAPEAHIQTIARSISSEAPARALMDADIIFGCTDDNAGRLVLSRIATYFVVPVIDCGVLLSSTAAGQLDGIFGRVTILHPGAACLVCRDRIDLARARGELMTPDERKRLADEGYAPALAGVEPAVVTFTTAVAAAAVSELLERLTAYGPSPVPNEILLRIHDREISTNIAEPRARHYCSDASGKLGLGITEPFLDQLWPS